MNEEYDFTNGIDGTVDIQGSINMPVGSTELMPIGDFLKLDDEESSMLSTDADGNYLLSVDGESFERSVEIPQFSINSDRLIQNGGFSAEVEIASKIAAEFPELDESMAVPSYSVTSTMEPAETEININEELGTEVTDVVKDIRTIEVNSPVELAISIKETGDPLRAGKVMLGGSQGFTITFPEFLTLEKTAGNFEITDGHILSFNNLEINAADPSSSVFSFVITGIDFSSLPEGQGMVDGQLLMNDKITLSELEIQLEAQDFGSTVGDLPEQVSIDLTLNVTDMSVKSISAVVDPQFKFDNEQFEIGELPEFLSGDNVKLDLYNPVISFDINADSKYTSEENFPNFALEAYLDAYKDGASTMDSPIGIVLSGENLIRKGANHYYISKRAVDTPESSHADYWHNVLIDNLSDIIMTIPDYIQIQDINVSVPHSGNAQTGYAESDYLDIVFPTDGSSLSYDIAFNYGLEVPLAFGSDLNIGYSTDFKDWNETFNGSSDSDYTIDLETAVISFDFVNSIPLTLDVSAEAIDLDGEVMSDISVNLDGSIEAGNIGSETTTSLNVTLSASKDAIKRFDGLKLNISATSASNPDLQGVALNKNQGIRLENIKLNLNGGVELNLNNKQNN